MAGNLAAIRQLDQAVGAIDAQPNGLLGSENLDAEPASLCNGAARQIAAAQSGWETEIVFDARAEARLPAGRFAFDDHGAQPFRRAINTGGEASRSTAGDDQIVKLQAGTHAQADLGGKFAVGRGSHARAVGKQDYRQMRRIVAERLSQAMRLRIGRLDVQPLIRHLAAGQKVPDLIGARRPAIAKHANAFKRRPVARRPVVQQIVNHGIKLLFRRVPGLEEIVMDFDVIDGADGRVGIGVSGEQSALGIGKQGHGFGQEAYTIHLRHALIGQQQGHGVVARLQLVQGIERHHT